MKKWRAGFAVVTALILLGGSRVPAVAQVPLESRLLREAAARESRGDLVGADSVLMVILAQDPTSSGALFALERVLRAQGSTARILPVVDDFLRREPGASGVRYLKLRALVDIDSLEALPAEAEAWFRLNPGSDAPYREVSRIWETAFGPAAALEVLRRGRAALGASDALALEIGDVLVAVDPEAAVREWARAVAPDGSGAALVGRRISDLPDRGGEAARDIVAELADSDLLPRRRAGAEIALMLGLEQEALSMSQEVASELDGRARASFLTDVARRARDGDLPSVAAWAYRALGSDATTPAQRRRFDERMVEVALSAGDTVAALEAQQRLATSFSPGSADRRRAVARAIRLESPQAGPERLLELLDSFRSAFPQAPELDDMAATVAASLMSHGDYVRAAKVLEGVDGPRSALERAYLHFDTGEVHGGRLALLEAVDGLSPVMATEVIQFASLLQRLSPAGAVLLAEAGTLAHHGDGRAAADAVATELGAIQEEDRPALLGEAARWADRGGARPEAAELRRRLLDEFPDAPEAAEASLSLARYLGRTRAGIDQAIAILEVLVTERPNAAVVPEARRELERLRSRRSP
jgi:tetratricopeptide (TPR) repeat protein